MYLCIGDSDISESTHSRIEVAGEIIFYISFCWRCTTLGSISYLKTQGTTYEHIYLFIFNTYTGQKHLIRNVTKRKTPT